MPQLPGIDPSADEKILPAFHNYPQLFEILSGMILPDIKSAQF